MLDVRKISSVLEAPFDNEHTTASCIADIVCATGSCETQPIVYLCDGTRQDTESFELLTAARQWLDQLLFLWISPSSSRSKTSSWLHLQLAALEAMIGILKITVRYPSPHGPVTETTVGHFMSTFSESGTSTSSLADDHGTHPQVSFYPFRHWCEGFAAMMEKALMLLITELRASRGAPERNSASSPQRKVTTITASLLRVEAIATLLAEMSTSIPLLHERVLGSISMCRQIARFLAAIEPWLQGSVPLDASPSNAPLAVQAVQRLLVWWCRSMQAFPHLARLGHIRVGLSGGLGQRLARLSCLEPRNSSGIGDVAASLLATLLLHSDALFDDCDNNDPPTAFEADAVAAHVSWMRIVGARAIADGGSVHAFMADDSVWVVYLRQQWVRLCGLSIGRVGAFHGMQQAVDAEGEPRRCAWCRGGQSVSPAVPPAICSDLVALVRMTGFFLVESSMSLSGGDAHDDIIMTMRRHSDGIGSHAMQQQEPKHDLSCEAARLILLGLCNDAASGALRARNAAQDPMLADRVKRIQLLRNFESFMSSLFQCCTADAWARATTSWPLSEVRQTFRDVTNATVRLASIVLRSHVRTLQERDLDGCQQERDCLLRVLNEAPLAVDQVESLAGALCSHFSATEACAAESSGVVADDVGRHRIAADVMSVCTILLRKLQ